MRELVLVFPDLHPLPDGAPAVGDDPLRLRFAAVRPLSGGWRAALARLLGREDLALAAPAELVAAAHGAQAQEWWLATPMHWQAGLTRVHVPPDAVLQLSESELEEVAQSFARTFGDDGLALLPIAGGHWLMRGLETDGADVPEPERLLGTTLDHELVRGAGASRLRALGSEIEMWLHGLPLNARREQAGLPRICALWLWGGGVMRRDGIAVDVRPVATEDVQANAHTVFCAADPWLRAACTLAAHECASPQRDADTTLEALLATDTDRGVFVGRFDRAAYELAMARVRDGSLRRASVLGSDRMTELAAGDQWRLWRPRRSLLEALA